MAKKIPEIGRRVVVYDPVLEKELTGVVDSKLSIQFTYLMDNGGLRFAFYDYQWRYEDE